MPPGSSLVFLGVYSVPPHCPQSWEKWGLWGAVTTYDYVDSDGEGETGWEAADGPLGEKYQFKRQMWEMVLQPGRDRQLLAPAARALMQSHSVCSSAPTLLPRLPPPQHLCSGLQNVNDHPHCALWLAGLRQGTYRCGHF